MRTTRQKRPDRVICKWRKYVVELEEEGTTLFGSGSCLNYFSFPKSEIPNLIKALQEVMK